MLWFNLIANYLILLKPSDWVIYDRSFLSFKLTATEEEVDKKSLSSQSRKQEINYLIWDEEIDNDSN